MKLDLGSYIELYITNECNLTCSDCNRFNNYDFRGHYSWAQSRDAILAWSQRITAPMITIIGGEPSLHPELEQWARGAAEAWPDRTVCIQSNGLIPITQMPWWPKAREDHPNLGTAVAVHSNKFQKHFSRVHDPQQQFDATLFTRCAIQDQGEYFTVHDSDPECAWRACAMAHSHTILKGRLYRCPMVAVLPEFQQQYPVVLTDQQHQLLHSYRWLDVNCSDQEIEQFIIDRNTPMPQCRLCPGQYQLSVIKFDPKRKRRPRLD